MAAKFSRIGDILRMGAVATALVAGAVQGGSRTAPQAEALPVAAMPTPSQIVKIRRLSESQYRNSIGDIFGADITVSGRFEPMVRPSHQLLASAAGIASISPAGMEQFEAMGQGIAAQVVDISHRVAFVTCMAADDNAPDAKCASETLTRLGRLLFRRPLSMAEQSQYVAIAERAARQRSSFYTGLQLALSAMLVSPQFLYVIERAEPDPANPGTLRLDDYSRAARLSFLVWNTTPDEGLLTAAGQQRLTAQRGLAQVAEAMVRSPRFEGGVRAFLADMLVLEMFDEMAKDPLVYPRFNPAVAKALPEQILRMAVDHLVVREGDYRQLFTTRKTFINRALGPVYGVPVPASQGWMPLEFNPADGRVGLIGQAGFLALYSHSGRSSPTLRGRAIRELLLCEVVPNPPGNVDFTAVQETTNASLPTARVRLSMHSKNPVCAGCHKLTDPLGLSLENFDGIGAFRSKENDALIDNAGALGAGSFQGLAGLGKAVAESESAAQCVANRAIEYATGQSSDSDELAAAKLEKQFAGDGYRMRALFLRLATMPELYRVKTLPAGAPQWVATAR